MRYSRRKRKTLSTSSIHIHLFVMKVVLIIMQLGMSLVKQLQTTGLKAASGTLKTKQRREKVACQKM